MSEDTKNRLFCLAVATVIAIGTVFAIVGPKPKRIEGCQDYSRIASDC